MPKKSVDRHLTNSTLQQREKRTINDLDTDCEILWVQIDLIGTKSLHIGSFYRPPNTDMTALDNLNLSLERLTHRTNGNILTSGLEGISTRPI